MMVNKKRHVEKLLAESLELFECAERYVSEGSILNNNEVKLKLLAQAIYEMRVLLSEHLGVSSNGSGGETVSAHLAYALHNEALAVIEDRAEDFDVELALDKIKKIESVYGTQFGGRFDTLLSN